MNEIKAAVLIVAALKIKFMPHFGKNFTECVHKCTQGQHFFVLVANCEYSLTCFTWKKSTHMLYNFVNKTVYHRHNFIVAKI